MQIKGLNCVSLLLWTVVSRSHCSLPNTNLEKESFESKSNQPRSRVKGEICHCLPCVLRKVSTG